MADDLCSFLNKKIAQVYYSNPYLTRHWLNVLLAPGINLMLYPNPCIYEKFKDSLQWKEPGKFFMLKNLLIDSYFRVQNGNV